MQRLALYNPFNAPVYHEETVGSTMDYCRRIAADGAAHGTVITADFQTAGRGRIRDRPWNMDRGKSLPFTILLRYPRIEEIPPALTLRTGLAVALAIEDCVPPLHGAALIKWPNDIMIRTPLTEATGAAKKAAGILAEADGGTVFIGIGINVAQNEFPETLRDKAVSLSLAAGIDLAPEIRYALLEKILVRLYGELARQAGVGEGGTRAAAWRGRILERLYKKGEQVSFAEGAAYASAHTAATAGRIVKGRLAGIGPGGELLITPEGESAARVFLTGELRVY